MSAKRRILFDPSAIKGPSGKPHVGGDASGEPAAMPVGLLVRRIKQAITAGLPERVAVVGELSNVKFASSGHMYFSMKDAHAGIGAVMWRSAAGRLKFRPVDGLEVIAEGKVTVYEREGRVQLEIDRMTPKGAGALELAFRQVCEKLQAEGLFDPAHRKPIPRFPRGVGLITSRTGAVVRDMQRTLAARWPAANVYLLPVPVQGDAAATAIADAVATMDANAEALGIDTILLGRGGGSLEDLWAFNEEVVARAVFAARTPIIAGVGHEVDTTIAELVADARAATPTMAAQMAVPDRVEVAAQVVGVHRRLGRSLVDRLSAGRSALREVLASSVFRDPMGRVRQRAQRIDEISHRMAGGLRRRLSGAQRRLERPAGRLAALHPARLAERARGRVERMLERLRWSLGGRAKQAGDELVEAHARLRAAHPSGAMRLARQRVESARRQLEALGYRNVLARGYSVTRDANGKPIRSAKAVKPGQSIRTELSDGQIDSTVDGQPVGPPRRKRPPKSDDQPGLFG